MGGIPAVGGVGSSELISPYTVRYPSRPQLPSEKGKHPVLGLAWPGAWASIFVLSISIPICEMQYSLDAKSVLPIKIQRGCATVSVIKLDPEADARCFRAACTLPRLSGLELSRVS